jgi:hypothetical protein
MAAYTPLQGREGTLQFVAKISIFSSLERATMIQYLLDFFKSTSSMSRDDCLKRPMLKNSDGVSRQSHDQSFIPSGGQFACVSHFYTTIVRKEPPNCGLAADSNLSPGTVL